MRRLSGMLFLVGLSLVDETQRVVVTGDGTTRIGPDKVPHRAEGDQLGPGVLDATLKRLERCWNACEGLTDEQIAGGVEAIQRPSPEDYEPQPSNPEDPSTFEFSVLVDCLTESPFIYPEEYRKALIERSKTIRPELNDANCEFLDDVVEAFQRKLTADGVPLDESADTTEIDAVDPDRGFYNDGHNPPELTDEEMDAATKPE